MSTIDAGDNRTWSASGYRVAAEEIAIAAWFRSLRWPCFALLRSLSRMSLNMSSSPKLSRYPGNIACTYRVAAVETSSNSVSSRRFMTSRKTTQRLTTRSSANATLSGKAESSSASMVAHTRFRWASALARTAASSTSNKEKTKAATAAGTGTARSLQRPASCTASASTSSTDLRRRMLGPRPQ